MTDELCGGCGNYMIVIPNPSESMLTSSGGFEQMKEAVTALGVTFDINELQLGMCPECDSTTLIGPRVTVSGEIVDQEVET